MQHWPIALACLGFRINLKEVESSWSSACEGIVHTARICCEVKPRRITHPARLEATIVLCSESNDVYNLCAECNC